MKCMATDRNGNIWLGTTKGLAKYDGNTFTYYNKTNSKLPTNWILSLLVDKNNKVWVGTPDGIVCIDGDNQTLFNKKNGLERERVVTIAQNSTGKVYFGITNIMGIAKFLYYAEDGVVKQEPIPETSIISNMVFDKNDNLWISSENSLLCKKNNGEFISYDSRNSPLLSTFNITQIFVIGSELWLNVETYDLYNSMSHPTGVAGPSDNAPISKETEILKRLKSKLTNLEPYEETIVLKLEEK